MCIKTNSNLITVIYRAYIQK